MFRSLSLSLVKMIVCHFVTLKYYLTPKIPEHLIIEANIRTKCNSLTAWLGARTCFGVMSNQIYLMIVVASCSS